MKGKILIVDDLHPVFKNRVEQLGYEVDDLPNITRAETMAAIAEYDGIAVRTKFRIDKELLDAAPKLKFVARAGAGLDNIDEAYANEKGILLINAPEGNRDALGEHAVALLLSLINNLRKADIEIRNGIWDREGNRGWELKGKTVGLIGYGYDMVLWASALRVNFRALKLKCLTTINIKPDFLMLMRRNAVWKKL
jgi:D-3-phosphoglycerate dehydrogenase